MKDRKQPIIDAQVFNQVTLQLFPEAKETKDDQLLVRCPFHDDKNPSLSVNVKSGLFNCFACPATGNFFDLYMKVKSVDFKTALADLEKVAGIEHKKASALRTFPQVVATLFITMSRARKNTGKNDMSRALSTGRSKSFAFYHCDELGKEKKGRGGEPLLYNLHLLSKAPKKEPFFFLEGEKKADILTDWDLCGTTLDSGGQSGKGPPGDLSFKKYFKGRDVYILPDNDDTGESYATAIADHLLGVAKSVKILRLPGLPKKGDIIDWS